MHGHVDKHTRPRRAHKQKHTDAHTYVIRCSLGSVACAAWAAAAVVHGGGQAWQGMQQRAPAHPARRVQAWPSLPLRCVAACSFYTHRQACGPEHRGAQHAALLRHIEVDRGMARPVCSSVYGGAGGERMLLWAGMGRVAPRWLLAWFGVCRVALCGVCGREGHSLGKHARITAYINQSYIALCQLSRRACPAGGMEPPQRSVRVVCESVSVCVYTWCRRAWMWSCRRRCIECWWASGPVTSGSASRCVWPSPTRNFHVLGLMGSGAKGLGAHGLGAYGLWAQGLQA